MSLYCELNIDYKTDIVCLLIKKYHHAYDETMNQIHS